MESGLSQDSFLPPSRAARPPSNHQHAHSTFDRDYISAEKVIEHHNRILVDFPAATGRVSVVRSDQVEFR